MNLIFSLLLTSSAFAQNFSAQQVAVAFQQSQCFERSRCVNGYSIQKLQAEQLQQLQPQIKNSLVAIAQSQAQIWGDTILEGDFWADGKTTVQTVTVLRSGQKVLGFHITYAERAWYVGDCQFQSNRPESLRQCRPGLIMESSFVSNRLDDAHVDENQFAKFIPRD